MVSQAMVSKTATARSNHKLPSWHGVLDYPMLCAILMLIALGLVMVGSASVSMAERMHDLPFYYLLRQVANVGVGLLAALIVLYIPLALWQRLHVVLLVMGFVLLAVVLLPGVGREVNGSVRWLPLGVAQLQVSEPVKLFVVFYLAGYLSRYSDGIKMSARELASPMMILAAISFLLLLEPDFGAAAVILATALGMLFIAGARWRHFLLILSVVVIGLAIVAYLSPYRLQRLMVFLNPWSDPFASGFQLTQALIAFGRGEWFGVGLGESIQKLSYLPEAHTDFLFAILAEELGLAGVIFVVGLFAFVVWRAFTIADEAARGGKGFAAFVAYGVAMWLGLQAFINIGVNMGILPTKGLTLPLMSYGGSSIVVTCVATALLLRVCYETRTRRVSSLEGIKSW